MFQHAQVMMQSEDDEMYCKRCRTSKPGDAFTEGYLQCNACREQQRRHSKVAMPTPFALQWLDCTVFTRAFESMHHEGEM